MLITRTAGIGLALAFVLASAGAAYAGWKLSTQRLPNGWVQEQSGDVRGHIEALRLLRAGKTAEPIELLESRLDDDIIALAPESGNLRPPVEEAMSAALGAARQYRVEHPRSSNRAAVDAMAKEALAREKPPR